MLKLVCAVWLNKLRAIVNEWKVYKKLRTRNIITMWWSVRLDSFVDVAVGWMRVCVCVYSFFPLLSCFLASLVFVFHSVWIQFIPFWLSSNRARNSHCYAVCMVCYNARFIWLNGIKCKTHKWIPSVDLWALLFLSDCAVVVVMPSYWWIEMTKWQILRHIYVWCATRSLTEVQLFGEVHVSLSLSLSSSSSSLLLWLLLLFTHCHLIYSILYYIIFLWAFICVSFTTLSDPPNDK